MVAGALPRVVNVTARDNTFTPSRTLLGAGDVYVEFVNKGEDPHDLHIARGGAAVEAWPVLPGWDGLTMPPLEARLNAGWDNGTWSAGALLRAVASQIAEQAE